MIPSKWAKQKSYGNAENVWLRITDSRKLPSTMTLRNQRLAVFESLLHTVYLHIAVPKFFVHSDDRFKSPRVF